jgi:hypothetical protein
MSDFDDARDDAAAAAYDEFVAWHERNKGTGPTDPLAELDASLDDAELAAVEGDFAIRVAVLGARAAMLVAWGEDDPRVVAEITPEERAEVLEWLDDSIAKTGQLLEQMRS